MSGTAGAGLRGAAREALRARLRALGFDEVRFAAAAPAGGDALRGWLEAGHQADMAWLERSAEKRGDPDRVVAGARTVVVLGVNQGPGPGRPAPGGVRVAHYAQFEDYHDTLRAGLAAAGRVLEETCGIGPADHRWYTDTGPVLERGWAARSGLGFRGKNAMLISRTHGNWLFLAVIVTRAVIAPDAPLLPRSPRAPAGDEPAGLLCGKCTRCLDACPTAAFPAPGVVDARRCVSYQTIENKGVIPRDLRAGIGDRVYGCDTCLDVCPWNRFARAGHSLLLVARSELAALRLADLLALTPEEFARVFRRTAVKRLKLPGLLRNACIAAGNSGDRAHLPALERLARHPSALVRAHAVWAVRRLAGTESAEILAAARAAETDPTVLTEHDAA
jgi:epoxyqueuosine reductase